MDRVRVMRLLIYEGPRDAIEKQLENCLKGTRKGVQGVMITGATLQEFPEILEQHIEASKKEGDT